MRLRRFLFVAAIVVLVGGGAAAFVYARSVAGAAGSDSPSVPTTRVVRGALDLAVHATGELRASHSAMLQAPPVGGGTLRILSLVETGSAVRKGDVVAAFDPTEQHYAREQALSDLDEAEQQMVKAQADLDVQAAQNRVDLLTAQFDVRRAELDAKIDADLIAQNEDRKRQLSLEEARRKLQQVTEAGTSRAETGRAALAVADENRTKARMAAERAEQNIESLVVKAPIDGYVVARENRDASGGFYYSGMTLPEYRAGDTMYPGRPVADVFDISAMEIRAKVNEQQRNNVAVGQAATVTSDGLPAVPLTAKVTSAAGLAQSDMWGTSGPLRDFDVTLTIDQADTRLRPGTSVQLVLAGSHVENVLHVPRQAIFDRSGQATVFVRVGNRFEPRTVKPGNRTETRVAIEGLAEGTEVALVDPDSVAKTKAAAEEGRRPDRRNE